MTLELVLMGMLIMLFLMRLVVQLMPRELRLGIPLVQLLL